MSIVSIQTFDTVQYESLEHFVELCEQGSKNFVFKYQKGRLNGNRQTSANSLDHRHYFTFRGHIAIADMLITYKCESEPVVYVEDEVCFILVAHVSFVLLFRFELSL